MKYWLGLLALVGSLGVSVGADGAATFTIQVTPGISLAPADVRVRARVLPDADNRALQIEADSGDFFRSSRIPLEGGNAPATTEIAFKGLPGGEYQVSVVLLGSRGVRGTLSRTVTVLPSASER